MELTPQQRMTLFRLVSGRSQHAQEPRAAVRWLRRYGLLDGDNQVTDEGRVVLAEEHAERRRRAMRGRLTPPDPTTAMRESIRRWKSDER